MHDFIAIGDTVIDAFIKLADASVVGTPDKSDYKICLPFADKVPYESVTVINAVGNAANAAVSASRLGLKTALLTNLGDDQYGKDCLGALSSENIDTKFVKIHPGKKTNYHYVLWFPPDRTILIKHETYPYELPDIGSPKWVYFSSVNEHAYPFHNAVADYVEAHPGTKLAFQPGKFEIKLGKEKLAKLYQNAEIFFCNVEEAEKILGIDTLGTSELLKRLREVGPKTVVITDGPKGAYAYDGKEMLFQPPYPQEEASERTGAGDAFASTVVSCLALGMELKDALQYASVNSFSVVQKIGAQEGLLSKDKIEEYLKTAPPFEAKQL
jgi:ribokinase